MKESLRVAVLARSVHPFHPYGGLERHVFDLVRHLLERDVVVTLVTRPATASTASAESPPIDGGLAHPALSVISVPYWTFPFAGRRGTTIADRNTAYLWFGWRAGRVATRLARDGLVDIVHGLGASCLGYERPPAPRRQVPLVFNPQGLEEFGTSQNIVGRLKSIAYRPLQAAVRRCAAKADRVIATDRVLVGPVRAHLGLGDDKIRTIPNAVDIEKCESLGGVAAAADLRRRVGAGANTTVLLSVGRLEENKGFHILATALERIPGHPTRDPNPHGWKWVLVGSGPFRHHLERLVTRLGLSSRVVFAGTVSDSDLHSWYRAADLFVHPTLYEGSSLVTLEAMVHRRAIIATRAGGLPDKIRPGVNGWLVDPGRAEPLATAIVEALERPDHLPVMGEHSRSIVDQQFSWDVAVDRLLTVYQELLSPSADVQADQTRP